VTLDLAGRGNNDGPVDVLASYGTIGLTLDANPSVSLALATNCGQIHIDFPAAAAAVSGALAADAGPEADCRDRPKGLAPLPGVIHLRSTAAMALGGGAMMLHAMALQGDIDINRRRAP
jgi:hypothetical protein